jgi:hypothetical protein
VKVPLLIGFGGKERKGISFWGRETGGASLFPLPAQMRRDPIEGIA